MKKITDERLILRNLQHIRILYVVQTFGILCILGYEFVQGGLDRMKSNPLWMLFMVTTIIYAYLTMSVSVEHEKEIKDPKRSLFISLAVLIGISAAVAYLTSITPGFGWTDGGIIGGIIFVCGLIPAMYIYRLRVKQQAEIDED